MARQLLALPAFKGKRVVDFGEWAGRKRMEVSEELLSGIDIAFFSGDGGTIAKLQPFAERVDSLIVVTLGAAGSVALTPHGSITVPAVPVDHPLDTTGCGDSFQAAFTVSYYRDKDIAKALSRGAQQAAQVLQHYGSFRQEPVYD